MTPEQKAIAKELAEIINEVMPGFKIVRNDPPEGFKRASARSGRTGKVVHFKPFRRADADPRPYRQPHDDMFTVFVRRKWSRRAPRTVSISIKNREIVRVQG